MHGSVEELEGYYANEDLVSPLLKSVSKDEREWSQIPGMPSFDKSTWNGIAVVPLLSSNYLGKHSHKSFESLLGAFQRYAENFAGSGSTEPSISPALRRRGSIDGEDEEGTSSDAESSGGSGVNKEVVWREEAGTCNLVLANNQLTRPGDWKYDSTPLRCFDWNNGCQRIKVFDGRPEKSRMAYDRVVNKAVGAHWADLIPSRRTAAVVGVLNCRDCLSDPDLLRQAENELHAWASLYSVPWYEVTAAFQGRSEPIPMDPHTAVLQRMFVFDSFDEDSQRCLNLSASPLGSSLVAFPPCDDVHTHMMDLHLNVVINDLAVAIFRNLEDQIRLCDSQAKAFGGISPHYARLNNSSELPTDIGSIVANTPSAVNVGTDGTANTESDDRPFGGKFKAAMATASTAVRSLRGPVSHAPPKPRFLYTPIDEIVDVGSLTPRDADAIKKRDVGRREKYTADLSLLAGSPLDALSRYSHSAELTKGHDPLWYAFSQLGCAESFIAMADMGGHGVDAYLENNFQYPEDIMTVLLNKAQQANNVDTSNAYLEKKYMDRFKTTLPNVVYNKTDEVLSILCKHPLLLPHYVQLLLKLARYISDVEDDHLQCLWGHGPTCYSGDTMSMGPPRWNIVSSDLGRITSADLKNTPNKRDYNTLASFSKIQRCSDLHHKAVSAGELDPRTRADVATTCARLCIAGIKATTWGHDHASPINNDTPFYKFPLLRKSAFFTTVAAQSMLQCSSLRDVTQRSASLWLAASNMYSRQGNTCMDYGHYAWASLRATMLHALSLQADPIVAEPAAELFMVLLSELSPENAIKLNMLKASRKSEEDDSTDPGTYVDYGDDDSIIESVSELSISSKKYANASIKKAHANPTASLTARSAFFNAIAPSAWSMAQSKWLEDDPIPHIHLPLVDPKDFITMDFSAATYAANLEESLFSHGLHSSQYISDGNNPDCSIASNLICINAVVPQIKFDACAKIQSANLIHLLQLRRDLLPTLSSPTTTASDSFFHRRFSVYNDLSPPIPPPIQVISANVVKSESHLLLDRCKAHGLSGKPVVITSMATFFNPYAAKKTTEGNGQSTLVAQGEERYILIVFENLLSTPLDIPSCQLEFDIGSKDTNATRHSIEVPPLSFTIPAKSNNFSVRFPFIVLASSPDDNATAELTNDENKQDEKISTDTLDLVGVCVTCLNRSFLIPFGLGKSLTITQKPQSSSRTNSTNSTANGATNNSNSWSQLPSSASIYLRSSHSSKKPKIKDEQLSVRIETVPPQPNLLVSFTTSQTTLEDSAVVPVHLSDGEIYTIPPFRLENDSGASGLGRLERLQIVGVGLPGLPDEILFDTDAEALAQAEKDDMFGLGDSDDEGANGSENSDFQELMEIDGLPPLRMKAIINTLSLKSINDPKQMEPTEQEPHQQSPNKQNKTIKGNVVTFQIAGMHDMGNSLANGGHVRIRFRYRGSSPNPATEIWRRREVNLRIVRVKGPRISSLSFRSDLSWGSAFTELSRALSQQKLRLGSIPKWGPGNLAKRKMASCNFSSAAQRRQSFSSADGNGHNQVYESTQHHMMDNALNNSLNLNDESSVLQDGHVDNSQSFVLTRVGRDAGVHVSADEIVVLMAVANETNSTIVLSNRKGRVGGFEGSPMPTVRVTSGVSVKIPVVIQRIERLDEEGQVVDIAAELISRTALQWESAVAEASPGDCISPSALTANSNIEKADSGTLAAASSSTSKARHGRVRIPSRCLREIIEEHKSFASRICKAPVHIRFDIGSSSSHKKLRNAGEVGQVQVSPGVFIETKVDVTMQDWVPDNVISNISFTLEFCCAKKDSETTNHVKNVLLNFDNSYNNVTASNNPYIWSGQLRRCIRGIKTRNEVMTHTARISFVERGTYVVSACVKISMFGVNGNEATMNYTSGNSASSSGEEIWWAPRAETVLVTKEN